MSVLASVFEHPGFPKRKKRKITSYSVPKKTCIRE